MRRTYEETAQRSGASNNAAISSAEDAPILDTELDAWQRAQDVNFRASFGRVVGAASTAG